MDRVNTYPPELVEPATMRDVHSAILRAHEFYFHRTNRANLDSIRAHGLQLNRLDTPSDFVPDGMEVWFGSQWRMALCISVPSSRGHEQGVGLHSDETVALAFPSSALAEIVALDWSVGAPGTEAPCVWYAKERAEGANKVDAFLASVSRHYLPMLISYGAIPAAVLRVQTDMTQPNPALWPPL